MMKKILLIFALFFAFASNAQSSEASREVKIHGDAKQNLKDLSKVVDFSQNHSLFDGVYQLFVYKHEQLSREGITLEEKKAISRTIEEKLIATFRSDEITTIRNTPGLYDKLIH